MSTQRIGRVQFKGRGPNGRRICAGVCGTEVPPRRIHWCGQDWCMDEWKTANWPSYARDKVWARDLGVCALCGTDTQPAERQYALAITALGPEPKDSAYPVRAAWNAKRREIYDRFLKDRGAAANWSGGWSSKRHQWEADHIVPVVEGGGGSGLDNLRTLCIKCHKIETAKLAARRARARRRERLRCRRVMRLYA